MPDNDAFEVLGRIEVDLQALKLSLAEAESEVQASADRQKKIHEESADAVVDAARRAQEAQARIAAGVPAEQVGVAGGGGPEPKSAQEAANDAATVTSAVQAAATAGRTAAMSAKAAGTEMSHLIRIMQMATGPIAQIAGPGLGGMVASLGHATRSMRYYGVAMGGAIAGVVLLSQVLSRYFAAAEKATAVTFEAGRALASLDAGRADAQIKAVVEDVAKLNLQWDQLSGAKAATWFQKVKAFFAIVTEDVTGGVAQSIKGLQELVDASVRISRELEVPKAAVEARKAEIEIMESVTKRAIASSVAIEDVAKGYNALVQAVRDKNEETKKEIELAEKGRLAFIKDAQKQILTRELAEADKKRDDALKKAADFETKAKQLGWGKSQLQAEAGHAGIPGGDVAAYRATIKKVHEDDVRDANARITGIEELEKASADRIAAKKTTADRQAAEEIKKRTEEGIATIRKNADEAAASAEKIIAPQMRILQMHRDFLGVAESERDAQARLNAERERSLAPLDAQEKAIQDVRKAREAEIAAQIASNAEENRRAVAGGRAAVERGAPEAEVKAFIDAATRTKTEHKRLLSERVENEDIAGRRLVKLNQERVEKTVEWDVKILAASRENAAARIKEEERVFSHAVATGRKTMVEEIAFSLAAARDVRRSIPEREVAERDAIEKRKALQEEYYKYARSLGMNTWAAEISDAEEGATRAARGSRDWFAQIQRIADMYHQIREAARGAVGAALQVSEQMARKRAGPGGKVSEFTTRREVEADFREQERLDREAWKTFMGGGQVRREDISGALGRQQMFEEFNKNFGSLGAALDAAFTPVAEKMWQSFTNIANTAEGFRNAWLVQMGLTARAAEDWTANMNQIMVVRPKIDTSGFSSGLGLMGERESRRAPTPTYTNVDPTKAGTF